MAEIFLEKAGFSSSETERIALVHGSNARNILEEIRMNDYEAKRKNKNKVEGENKLQKQRQVPNKKELQDMLNENLRFNDLTSFVSKVIIKEENLKESDEGRSVLSTKKLAYREVSFFDETKFVQLKDSMRIYDVVFSHFVPAYDQYFACGGENQLSVYKVVGTDIQQVGYFYDPTSNSVIYCVVFCVDQYALAPVLCFGSRNGLIRVLDISTSCILNTLVGHGQEVNEIRAHPTNLDVIISCSVDESCRIWNWQSGCCLAILKGHIDQVLTLDIQPVPLDYFAPLLVTGGIDHCVKIWNLDSVKMTPGKSESRALLITEPIFSTNQIHDNYVDCVRWNGNMIISKAAGETSIVGWNWVVNTIENKFGASREEHTFTRLFEMKIDECYVWWQRFSVYHDTALLRGFIAIANGTAVSLFYIPNSEEVRKHQYNIENGVLQIPPSKSFKLNISSKPAGIIRQVAISHDGSNLVAVGDNSIIYLIQEKT